MNSLIDTIIHGDCLAVLQDLPDSCIDFVLTDPPYMVNYRDRSGRRIRGDRGSAWVEPAFAEIARVMKPDTLMLSFYGWTAIDVFMTAWREAGLRPVDHMVAHKGYISSSRYFDRCHEQAMLLAKGNPPIPGDDERLDDVRSRWKYTGNEHHPTQKPVRNLAELISCFCPEGGIVLDPFAGSGSTCLAAESTGRRFLGIEIDRRYHAAAIGRMGVKAA